MQSNPPKKNLPKPNISLTLITTKFDHKNTIWSTTFSPDKKTLLTTSSDKSVLLYTYTPESQTLTLCEPLPTSHKKTIRSLTISPDSSLLACGSFDSTISIFLLTNSTFDCVSKIEGHESEVKCVEFHPTRKLLATCGRDKTVWVWEYNDDFEFFCVSIINAHEQDVKKVRWVPRRDLLVSCSYDESVKIWKEDEEDEEEFFEVQVFKEHQGTVWDVCFDAQGERMFSCSEDKSVVFYEWREGAFFVKERVVDVGFRDVYCMVFDSLVDVLFTGSADNMVKGFFVGNGKMEIVFEVKAHDFDVNCLAIYEEGRILASVGDDRKLKLWKY